MTTTDELERRLQRLFFYPLAAPRARAIDERVRAIPRSIGSRRGLARFSRTARRSLLLATALVLAVAAAAIGSLELFERVAFDAPAGYRTAWERAAPIGITVETEAGELTIDRGYADANRVILAIAASDPDVASATRLRDAAGREYRPFGGPGYTELTGDSASLMAWDAPEPIPTGDLSFTVSSHDALGPDAWSAEFVLPVQGGVTVHLDQSVEREGITVSLHAVTVSPTAVRAEVTIGPFPEDMSWAAAHWGYERDGENPFDNPAQVESLLADG
ncbi:MAG: hypothetical protein H0U86_06555, partial [Chloroflexi bacterium]|nr:hypothetical protein [Chloroflexota bacterium]